MLLFPVRYYTAAGNKPEGQDENETIKAIKKASPTDKPVSEELQKKRELTERLLASNVVGGRRIKTLQSFRNHVTSHEYPVIVLFKTK